MSIIGSPCKGCQNRQLLCHSNCSKYIDFKERLEVAKETIRRDKLISQGYYSHVVENRIKHSYGFKQKYGYI